MMGKTHFVIGVAAALAVTRPTTPQGCVAAVVGGAMGGVLSDLDLKHRREIQDALVARLLALGLVILALLIDFSLQDGLTEQLRRRDRLTLTAGLLLFALLCLFGMTQQHRGFLHSLAALALLSLAVWMFSPPLLRPFAAGFGSHLVIDLPNKRPLRLFWPLRRGVCLHLTPVDGPADHALLLFGLSATAVYLAYAVVGMG